MSRYDEYFVGLDCDVTKPEEVENCIRGAHIDAVLHLAAKSDVDWCQKPEHEKTVSNVNLRGTFNVCAAAEKFRLDVLLLSTDHVFSGTRGRYSEKDKPYPINQYGLSKFAAEGLQKAFDNLKIVRTSYLFDSIRLSQLGEGEYPTFIVRSFMYLPHFADNLCLYLENIREMPSILHLSGANCISWYEFMSDLLDSPSNIVVRPRRYELERGEMAPRPKRGGLNIERSRILGFPQWSYGQGIEQMEKDMHL